MRKLIALLVGCLLTVACFAQTKPAVLPAWGLTAVPTTDIVQPANSFISAGWQSSSTPPSRQYFNWVLNYATNGVQYLMKRGIADWDTSQTYSVGDLAQASTGAIYRSVAAGNTGNNPTSTTLGIFWDVPLVADAAGGAFDSTGHIATTSWIFQNYIRKGATFSAISGQIQSAQVPLPAVQQWQGSLAINFSQLSGVPSSTQASPNTLALRDPNGFLFATYLFQTSANSENLPISQVMTTDGTDFAVRKSSLAFLEASMNLPQIAGVASPAQLSTANTPPVGSSDSRIATTAFANPSQSLAAFGRTMLPGGLIMQWGTVTVAASTVPVDVAIGFPQRFPTATFGVFVSTNRNVSANGQAVNGSGFASNITTSGATITIDTSGGGSAKGTWFAIGN